MISSSATKFATFFGVFLLLFAGTFAPVHAQQRGMINGGFEQNDPAGSPNWQIFTSAAVPGWDATPDEIEIWDSGYSSVTAYEGAVFDEINANGPTALYQNICLVNGESIKWSFAHRARSGGAATQTARFEIANSSGTVLQTLATQASTTAQGWNLNSNGTGITYTGVSGVQRVQFSTSDTGATGNFLDGVSLYLKPHLQFSSSSGSASENVSSSSLPALIVSGQLSSAITVNVAVTGGTATLGTDYTTPGGGSSFTVTLPAGNYDETSVPLGISIVDDSSPEASETIALSITATPANYTIANTASCNAAGISTSTYSITDNDSGIAGTPPTLVCPVGSTIFDWDAVSWSAGSLNNNYAVTGIGTVNFGVSIQGGVFLSNATYGGQAPARQNVVTGGLTPAQYSLFEITDFTSQSGTATTTITLPTPVPGAQFRIFDVDYNSGQFADMVTVTGSYHGTAVTPILTNGVSNYVSGHSIYGNALSDDNSANGNAVVTFSSPVDTISLAYGNHSIAPANPGQQAITIHDITFCNPQVNLTVAKSSTVVSDGVNPTNPKAIPGAVLRYCLLVSNAGSGTATGIAMSDAVPASMTYVPGSMHSGANCAAATNVEDDDNSGADENDPFGASVSGSTISAEAASLTASNSFALTFSATVN